MRSFCAGIFALVLFLMFVSSANAQNQNLGSINPTGTASIEKIDWFVVSGEFDPGPAAVVKVLSFEITAGGRQNSKIFIDKVVLGVVGSNPIPSSWRIDSAESITDKVFRAEATTCSGQVILPICTEISVGRKARFFCYVVLSDFSAEGSWIDVSLKSVFSESLSCQLVQSRLRSLGQVRMVV